MKIILLCGAGMSASLMAKRMEKAAEKQGIKADITARAYTQADAFSDDVDLYLLGPQIAYFEARCKEQNPNTPVYVINSLDYGTMNGEKVFHDALKAIEACKK